MEQNTFECCSLEFQISTRIFSLTAAQGSGKLLCRSTINAQFCGPPAHKSTPQSTYPGVLLGVLQNRGRNRHEDLVKVITQEMNMTVWNKDGAFSSELTMTRRPFEAQERELIRSVLGFKSYNDHLLSVVSFKTDKSGKDLIREEMFIRIIGSDPGCQKQWNDKSVITSLGECKSGI
eukprot:Gb_40666 [translate_table: standard]